MFKALLILAFTMIATTLMATPPPLERCTCSVSFSDFIGNEYDTSAHVTCPATPKENLECEGGIDNHTFTTTCTNAETGEANTTTVQLDPWSDPTYAKAYCHLN